MVQERSGMNQKSRSVLNIAAPVQFSDSEQLLRISSVTGAKFGRILACFTTTARECIPVKKKRSNIMNRRIIAVLAVIVGLTTVGALVYAGMDMEENKQQVAMTELPAAVQKTIQDNLGGGTVIETAKETEGGSTYYEAEIQKSGGEKVQIKIAEDGKLISVGKGEDEDND
jgi:hypothetical protein